MSNDKPNVPLSFDRTKLLNDTANFPKAQDTATIIITSNAYGVDSIVVIAVK